VDAGVRTTRARRPAETVETPSDGRRRAAIMELTSPDRVDHDVNFMIDAVGGGGGQGVKMLGRGGVAMPLPMKKLGCGGWL